MFETRPLCALLLVLSAGAAAAQDPQGAAAAQDPQGAAQTSAANARASTTEPQSSFAAPEHSAAKLQDPVAKAQEAAAEREAAAAAAKQQEAAAETQAAAGAEAQSSESQDSKHQASEADAKASKNGKTAPGDKVKKLSGMSILGNQEAPKSLVIVPWKSSEIGAGLGVSRALDTSIRPVDRDVFARELEYYEIRSNDAKQ